MATLQMNEFDAPTKPGKRDDEFAVVTSDRGLGRNLPQRVADKLWAPMLAMALMAFPAAVVLAAIRADLVASGAEANAESIAQLHHVTAGVMFLGFAAVFSAITFAIARILGEFRAGGGNVQQAAGSDVQTLEVQTLEMPGTARLMLVGMMMAMMLILVPVVIHFVAAGAIVGPSEAELLRSEQWFDRLEAIRRIGVATYLTAITFGLATILRVLRFQSIRIREVAAGRSGR